MKTVVHIEITEREAIYVDGQFWDEGDSFNWPYVIEKLAEMGQFQWVHHDWTGGALDQWACDNGTWPETLAEAAGINAVTKRPRRKADE